MKAKINKHSLMFNTLAMLIFFSVIILILLYCFQYIFTNYYYEKNKIDQVYEISNLLEINISNLETYLIDASVEYDVCIEYVTTDGNIFLYNEEMKGCLLENNSNKITSIMDKMYSSSDTTTFYRITNPLYNTKSFLYGTKLSNGGYIYINSQLESLDNTFKILNRQLIYLLFIIIIFAIILSVFISNTITRPIKEITNKAKEMGKGNLHVKFEKSKIREIDELNEALDYAQTEMKKTDDYRRDIMANVGHDLKTPLTLIKSYAEMVRDISYKDDDKRNAHLNVIINESDRLNTLVNDIISLSKLEAGAEKLNIEQYDLVEEVKAIISKFQILEITESYNFLYSGPEIALVKADKNKMDQVIYNLVNNAINYTGDDMKVYINITKIKEGYKVEIIDTGKGIDDETIKHVWDRYYKTDKMHKRNKVGTGLGLSIVREILESHKFTYGVESTLGKGTNFYFVVKSSKNKNARS